MPAPIPESTPILIPGSSGVTPAPVPTPEVTPVPVPTPEVTPVPVPTPEVTPASVPPVSYPLPSWPEMLTAPAVLPPQELLQAQQVRPLPGGLDQVPVFNSNSPELVLEPGILLSTFSPQGMAYPSAHLNYTFEGRFDIFAHHLARADQSGSTLFEGIILYNPDPLKVVRVNVLAGASYLTDPEALFLNLPSYVADPLGQVYSGPGSRVAGDLLRGEDTGSWPREIILDPGQYQMLMNLPITTGGSGPATNGRSTMIRLESNGPVNVADMAMFAPERQGHEQVPTLQEWEMFLQQSPLAGPRDLAPTPMDAYSTTERIFYGRVAGVEQGSTWQATVTDTPSSDHLTIPMPGVGISYGISTLPQGTLGTGQVQSAPMLVRYPDTAYLANGNYGVEYNLTFPLYNPTNQPQTVSLSLQTPLKVEHEPDDLRFYDPPEDQIFFRGPVRITYTDDSGQTQTTYIHVVQRRGQAGKPLVTLNIAAGQVRDVNLDFIYPPDSTPPQVLTISTLGSRLGGVP